MTEPTTTPSDDALCVTALDLDLIRQKIIAAIRTIYDPELPVNIYDLGLIYRVEVDESQTAFVDMTLTSPSCPEAQSLPAQVEEVVQNLPEVKAVKLELVWEPPWDKDCMSDEVKLLLGLF